MKRNRAVMEDRAPEGIEEENPERKRWRQLGWFATPPWAVRAGAELLQEIDEFADHIWEPACGDGLMARVLGEDFAEVYATDIEPCGPFRDMRKLDFLIDKPITDKKRVRWVFTNPPFHLAEQFVRRGLEICELDGGVMVLARTAFLESAQRYPLFRDHLTHVAPFCERVGMQLGPWNPRCSTATSYAWFVFSRSGYTQNGPRLHLIPPGTAARLSKIDDVPRFAVPTAAPLVGPHPNQ